MVNIYYIYRVFISKQNCSWVICIEHITWLYIHLVTGKIILHSFLHLIKSVNWNSVPTKSYRKNRITSDLKYKFLVAMRDVRAFNGWIWKETQWQCDCRDSSTCSRERERKNSEIVFRLAPKWQPLDCIAVTADIGNHIKQSKFRISV